MWLLFPQGLFPNSSPSFPIILCVINYWFPLLLPLLCPLYNSFFLRHPYPVCFLLPLSGTFADVPFRPVECKDDSLVYGFTYGSPVPEARVRWLLRLLEYADLGARFPVLFINVVARTSCGHVVSCRGSGVVRILARCLRWSTSFSHSLTNIVFYLPAVSRRGTLHIDVAFLHCLRHKSVFTRWLLDTFRRHSLANQGHQKDSGAPTSSVRGPQGSEDALLTTLRKSGSPIS